MPQNQKKTYLIYAYFFFLSKHPDDRVYNIILVVVVDF